jgi:hypothetical protein
VGKLAGKGKTHTHRAVAIATALFLIGTFSAFRHFVIYILHCMISD